MIELTSTGGKSVIETHTCPNGLRIVLEEIPTVRSVTIGVWILTGSRNEADISNGMSHFLEHMLFKGTENRSAQDIAEEFDSIGGQVNAFTSKEYTCYYARVLDTHKDYALEILTDMFFHSTFEEDEIEREKKVIVEEIKMYEDTPDDLVHELLSAASFGNHPLGKSILGPEELVKGFSRAEIIDFKDNHYTANNVVISVAGNADEKFLQKIETAFDQFTKPNQELPVTKPIFQYESIIRKKETEQVHLCYGYNGVQIGDDSMMSLSIASNVLGGGMSSRLFQEVREKQGLAYSVYAYPASFRDSGLLTIYAGTNKEQLPLLESTIADTIAHFVDKGITEKELKNNKEQFKGNLLLSLESMSSRMNRNARNELFLRRHRSLDDIIQEVDEVDLKMVQNVIEKVLNQKYATSIVTPKV